MKNLWIRMIRIWKEWVLVLVAGFSWIFFILGGAFSVLLIFLWFLHVWEIYTIQLTHMGLCLGMFVLGLLGVYFLDWRQPGKILKTN